MRRTTVYLSVFALTLLLGLAVTYWMWHRSQTATSIEEAVISNCPPNTRTLVLSYEDFGPPSMSFRLEIGNAWNQWKNEGHELPDDVDIKVVVYRDVGLEQLRKDFPVVRGKSDYRFVEYTRALQFLQEEVKTVESYKKDAIYESELKMWDELEQTLKKTHRTIVRCVALR